MTAETTIDLNLGPLTMEADTAVLCQCNMITPSDEHPVLVSHEQSWLQARTHQRDPLKLKEHAF